MLRFVSDVAALLRLTGGIARFLFHACLPDRARAIITANGKLFPFHTQALGVVRETALS